MLKNSREHLHQAIFIFVWSLDHRDTIKVNPIFLVQFSTLHRDPAKCRDSREWSNLKHVHIGSRAAQAIEHCDHETANAIEANGCVDRGIQLLEKEFHGSGGLLGDGMVQLLHGEIGQQIPMLRRL